MRRRIVLIAFALAVTGVLAVAAGAMHGGQTTATVTRVSAGDTLQVRLSNGKSQTLHVLGIVAPRAKSCYATESMSATSALALSQTVKLSTTGAAAYVTLPDGSDLGAQLIQSGAVQLDTWGKPVSRFASYVPLQQAAESANKGLWGACAADVSIALKSAPDTVGLGGRIVYTATIANAGPLPAANVNLDVRAPDGNPFETAAGITSHTICTAKGWYATCDILSIPAGGSADVTFTADAAKEGVVNASAFVRLDACARAACGDLPVHDANLVNNRVGAFTTILAAGATAPPPTARKIPLDHWVDGAGCDPHYPTVCIPSPPPKVDCADLSFRAFKTLHDPTASTPDPNALDNDFDGVGCTFNDY